MLKFLSLILLFHSINSFSQDELSKAQTADISKYSNTQSNTLFISTGFNEAPILDKTQLEKLKDRKIYHVDFVYTAYRESETFDQNKLNQSRVSSLKEILPQLTTDEPTWSVFKQIGAKSRDEAKTYFHGFVIHYGAFLEYQQQNAFFQEIQTPFSTVQINNQTGGRAAYISGSSIEMDKYAVTFPDGSPVEGFYTLKYREFRNQSEIALSGIPMVFSSENEELFNSAGMYEIRAERDGQELILKKPAIVNFQTTDPLDGVAFYDMDKNGHWDENQKIEFTDEGNPTGFRMSANLWSRKSPKKITLRKYNNNKDIDEGDAEGYDRRILSSSADYNEYMVEIDKVSHGRYKQLKQNGDSILFATKDQGLIKKNYTILVPVENAIYFVEQITGLPIDSLEKETIDKGIIYKTKGFNSDTKLVNVLGDEPIPPSPGLVRGLKSDNFGVYNCDQIFRILHPIPLTPTYFDLETGIKLENLYVACVIDMDMNASLSYHPNHLVVNERGNNQLVLFNEKREVFLMDEAAFKNVDLKQMDAQLNVLNVTHKIKSPADLQELLKI
ncbi:MAG: hypothetical protein GQ574_12380 [Crocinitomix sp.]|nr:hypothetical protein [Crocinitomix sp.]